MYIGYSRPIALAAILIAAAGVFQQTVRPTLAGVQAATHSATPAEKLKWFAEQHDLAFLWIKTDNSQIYGFIGADYQRLRIHFSSVKKDPQDPIRYFVRGRTLVKNNICDFDGTIVLQALRNPAPPYKERGDFDKENGYVEGEISAKYLFKENPQQRAAGIFEGFLKTLIYTDRSGRVHYDDVDISADGYSNNLFSGTWKSYRGNTVKKCNWGDYRIPDCGDLDGGAGEFFPVEKYLRNGWQGLEAERRLRDEAIGSEKAEVKEWWQ
jgi:hypothetical protein